MSNYWGDGAACCSPAHSIALTVGLDGVLPLIRRTDLVPQLRADWAGLGALFRGGISVRAHF